MKIPASFKATLDEYKALWFDGYLAIEYFANNTGEKTASSIASIFGNKQAIQQLNALGETRIAIHPQILHEIDEPKRIPNLIFLLQNEMSMYSSQKYSDEYLEKIAMDFLKDFHKPRTFVNFHFKGNYRSFSWNTMFGHTTELFFCAIDDKHMSCLLYTDDE
ncbi:hypothetical protein [Undibacterium sp. Ji49W]|uniref:hypothetical protein n=1 Tax=Undibacterium sp. Ji49W TaxID=3413040 RepID=UPI003BF090A5